MENVVEKLKNLSLPEKLIAGGGALMFIASFFPWWSWSEGPFSFHKDGWGAPGSIWSVLVILIALALMGLVLAVNLADVKLPDPTTYNPKATWGTIYGGAGGLLALLMLLKFWRIMAAPAGGMGWGFFIAIIAAAAIVAGCAMVFQEEKRRTTV